MPLRLTAGSRTLPREGGFTLLEVLLAFVVFALSFATVLEILSGSMRSSVRAREYSEAALLAQSLMDQVGTEFPLLDGIHQGDAPGGFAWTVDVTEFVPATLEEEYILQLAESNGTLLYWVEVRLEWGSGLRTRDARFATVRGVLQGREDFATVRSVPQDREG